ncbi:MAG: class I SAM-dependent methyltransferase [Phycisphaerales bacterium]|nr:class I SAM-dependent methyltransferase [Phycisphaerales bacterium]
MDPTQRFTSRAAIYTAARPGYPRDILRVLEQTGDLRRPACLADVGCGTGKLAEIFLEAGYDVIGVEPNDAMRAAGDEQHRGDPRFRSVSGRAEATTLGDRSVDAIVCGQAFHWFEPVATRREFARILKPGGLVALIWNNRATGGDAFHTGYEALLRQYCPEYVRISAGYANPEQVRAFFAPAAFQHARFENSQTLDLGGLLGRLLSSSYVPQSGPDHEALQRGVEALFQRHADNGRIRMRYDTELFFGKLA